LGLCAFTHSPSPLDAVNQTTSRQEELCGEWLAGRGGPQVRGQSSNRPAKTTGRAGCTVSSAYSTNLVGFSHDCTPACRYRESNRPIANSGVMWGRTPVLRRSSRTRSSRRCPHRPAWTPAAGLESCPTCRAPCQRHSGTYGGTDNLQETSRRHGNGAAHVHRRRGWGRALRRFDAGLRGQSLRHHLRWRHLDQWSSFQDHTAMSQSGLCRLRGTKRISAVALRPRHSSGGMRGRHNGK